MRLEVVSGPAAGLVLEVGPGAHVLGRGSESADLVVPDPMVSSRHVRFEVGVFGATVTDLGSTNGSALDGQALPADVATPLREGSHLALGGSVVLVTYVPVAAAPGAGTATPAAPSELRLSVQAGPDAGQSLIVLSEPRRVGRAPDCDLVLSDGRASSHHLQARLLPDGAIEVSDLGSSNGTLVNGESIDAPTRVQPGDEIQVGESVLVAVTGAEGASRVGGPAPTIMGTVPKDIQREVRRSRRGLLVALVLGGLAAVAAVAAIVLTGGSGDGGKTTSTATAPRPLTVADVADLRRSATVSIFDQYDPSGFGASGSGVVIDAVEGYVLTNNHVATGGTLSLWKPDKSATVPANLVASLPCDDVALLQIASPADRAIWKPAPIGDSQALKQGEAVVAMGFPGSAEGDRQRPESLSVTDGIVSKNDVPYDSPSDVPRLASTIQHTAAINPGNSGGPLFNMKGELVGLNTATFGDEGGRKEGENYAITTKRIKELLADLKAGVSRNWVGISPSFLQTSTGEPAGFRIEGISPGSPAAVAGLKPGYIVVAIDGRPAGTVTAYCELLDAAKAASRTPVWTVADQEGENTTEVTFAPKA